MKEEIERYMKENHKRKREERRATEEAVLEREEEGFELADDNSLEGLEGLEDEPELLSDACDSNKKYSSLEDVAFDSDNESISFHLDEFEEFLRRENVANEAEEEDDVGEKENEANEEEEEKDEKDDDDDND